MYTVTVESMSSFKPNLSRYQVKINETIVGYGWKNECESLSEELTGDDDKCKKVLEAMEELDD